MTSVNRAAYPNYKGFAAVSDRVGRHRDYGRNTFLERLCVSSLCHAARHSRKKQLERIDARWRRTYARVVVTVSGTAALWTLGGAIAYAVTHH